MSSAALKNDLTVTDGIAILRLDNPPVNALSQAVRASLMAAVEQTEQDQAVRALVIACAGKTFIAGADISEFGQPPCEPFLPDVIERIAASTKPVIAAIHGTALGGGLEVAMACHYRIADLAAQLGMPEVKLGLMPGSRGTQNLPRLVGMELALDMIALGEPIDAQRASAAGLVDMLAEGDLETAAAAFALRCADQPHRSTRDTAVPTCDPVLIDNFMERNARKFRGLDAPPAIARALRAAAELPYDEGARLERQEFLALRAGPQSAALRHNFAAERSARKVPGLEGVVARPIARVGVIGGGTMGTGIALAFLTAGYPVILIEREQAALARGVATIASTLNGNVSSGRMTQEVADSAQNRLDSSLEMTRLSDVDLVVEAAFETMEIKSAIFAQLDQVARQGAILATNTSYLDIDQIAAATRRPQDVVGLHFFSPANIMKLLEVVRGRETAPDVIATALHIATRIGKIPVVSGNAYGFIGNRMLAVRRVQAEAMVVEGASPEQVDRVLERFGFAMGPFRMADLAGLDLGWSAERSKGLTLRDCFCEAGRKGQKASAGFYDYDEARKPQSSAASDAIIAGFAQAQGITQRSFNDDEILDRLLWPMINEGARLLGEGIALRASDIDVVWINGYGWPAWTGGPMYHARKIGLDAVRSRLLALGLKPCEALAAALQQ